MSRPQSRSVESPHDPVKPVPWAVVSLLGALIAFAPMSIDMYLPALPSLTRDLGTGPEGGHASLSAFFLGLALGQFVYGPLSDRFGRRLPVMIGISLYVVASVICVFAPTIEALIAARFVQALGGCAGMVVARAVVRDRFDHTESARIFSFLMLVMGIAPIVAPLVGSLVLSLSSWRTIFIALALFGAVMGLWVWRALSESRSEAVRQQALSENPLRAYGALLQKPRLIGYVLVGALSGACLFTYIATSADLLIQSYGLSPTVYSWVFGLNAVGIIGASQINRALLRRYRPDEILRAGVWAALAFGGLLTLAAFSGVGGLWTLLPALFLVLATYGLLSGNAQAGALSVDPLRAGSASALIGGVSFGVGALVSTIASQFYDGTPRAMAATILVCLALSVVCLLGLALRGSASAQPAK